jgi:uncharacterized protein
MIQSTCGDHAEAEFLASIIEGDFVIEDLTANDYIRCHELIVSYAELPLGTVDASIVRSLSASAWTRLLH